MPLKATLATATAAAAIAATASAQPATLRDIQGATTAPLAPSRAALLIIDAQNEYAEGPLKLHDLRPAVAEIGRLRRWAHDHDVPVIHIRHEGAAGAAVFAAGRRGADFLPDVTPEPGETVITKTYPNSFNRTDLDTRLKAMGRDQLILTGFMTHMCVDSTARAGFDLGYRVYIVASATADRPIPAVEDGLVIRAPRVRQVTLAALADRFAWIIPSSASMYGLTAGAKP